MQVQQALALAKTFDLDYPLQNPTTLQTLQGFETQLQQSMMEAVEPLLPSLRDMTTDLTQSLVKIREGRAGLSDYSNLIPAGVALAGVAFASGTPLDRSAGLLNIAAASLVGAAETLSASSLLGLARAAGRRFLGPLALVSAAQYLDGVDDNFEGKLPPGWGASPYRTMQLPGLVYPKGAYTPAPPVPPVSPMTFGSRQPGFTHSGENLAWRTGDIGASLTQEMINAMQPVDLIFTEVSLEFGEAGLSFTQNVGQAADQVNEALRSSADYVKSTLSTIARPPDPLSGLGPSAITTWHPDTGTQVLTE